ncbi:MAG: hypothetical protein HY741_09145, partial [Chloroflexi bacterium]|nr:hypothetical protein [Chloroflexota bacterium]
MKRGLIALIVLLALVAIVAVPAKTTNAANGAVCVTDPEAISIDEVAFIVCTGFSPNTHVWVYSVEPDGAAAAYGSVKSDEDGTVAFTFAPRIGNFGAAALGTWTLVVEEKGLANSII